MFLSSVPFLFLHLQNSIHGTAGREGEAEQTRPVVRARRTPSPAPCDGGFKPSSSSAPRCPPWTQAGRKELGAIGVGGDAAGGGAAVPAGEAATRKPGGELRGIGVRFPTDGGAVRVPGPAESSHAGLGLACLRRRRVGPEVSPRRRGVRARELLGRGAPVVGRGELARRRHKRR
jgi:hypothetical protein